VRTWIWHSRQSGGSLRVARSCSAQAGSPSQRTSSYLSESARTRAALRTSHPCASPRRARAEAHRCIRQFCLTDSPCPFAIAASFPRSIFRHKRWGFRGVIVDWHASCPAEEPWPTRHGPFEDGLTQPFYRTLVCTRDRPNPFMTLAAAENLLAVRDDSADALRPVEHPMLDKLFDGFRGGRHIIAPSNWDAYSEDF
jgi:hemimethylated DNA binding protein